MFPFHRWARHPSKARPSLFGNMRIGRDEKYNWRRWEIQLAEMRNTDDHQRASEGKIQITSLMRRQWDLYTVPSIGQRPTCPLLELNWRLCHWVVLNFHSTPISSSELQLCGWHLSFVPSGRRLALHRSRSQKVKPRRFLQGGITAFPLLPRHRTTTSFQLQTNIGFYAIQSMIQLSTATPTPTILTLMTHFEVFRWVFFFQK